MSEVRYVIVTNMINGNISIKKPHLGLNRQWQRFGQKMRIPFDILEEALWDEGVRNLFSTGYLYIENLQDKIDLVIDWCEEMKEELIQDTIALEINGELYFI